MLCPQNMSLGPGLPESIVWHVLKRNKGHMLLLMMMMDDDDVAGDDGVDGDGHA